jgi:hypothetical protein
MFDLLAAIQQGPDRQIISGTFDFENFSLLFFFEDRRPPGAGRICQVRRLYDRPVAGRDTKRRQ